MSEESFRTSVPGDVLAALQTIGGPGSWLSDPDDLEPYVNDSRHLFHGDAALVLRPADTQQVSAIVRLCAEAGVKIYPAGGRTGMVGGGVPQNDRSGIVVSLERMTRIRQVDALDNTMTVDAGCILASAQAAAAAADRLLPMSLNAEGSCTIGGNVSTNAGGIQVLRYGNMRELVLGLEVVLPSGEIWDGLRTLRKDNTGYDLKHLFIGAEGTLGIVTGGGAEIVPASAPRADGFSCAGNGAEGSRIAVVSAGFPGRPADRVRNHVAFCRGMWRPSQLGRRSLWTAPSMVCAVGVVGRRRVRSVIQIQ